MAELTLDSEAHVREGDERAKLAARIALWVCLAFALCSIAFVWLSERMVLALSPDATALGESILIRSGLLIAATTVALYFFLRMGLGRVNFGSAHSTADRSHPRRPFLDARVLPLLLVFGGLLISLGVSGWYIHSQQIALIEGVQYRQLTAIAQDKAERVEHWLLMRERSVLALATHPSIRNYALERASGHSAPDAELRVGVNDLLSTHAALYEYPSVRLLGRDGQPLDADAAAAPSCEQASIAQAAQLQRAQLSLLLSLSGEPMKIGMVAPVVGEDGTVLGAICAGIDSQSDLPSIVEKWPGTAKSAEALMVHAVDGKALYLSELNVSDEGRMQGVSPVGARDLLSVMAVRGVEGTVRSVDYRGVPVFAAIRPVSDGPWSIIAKINIDEVVAPHRALAQWTAAMTLLFVIMAAGITALLWSFFAARWRMSNYFAVREAELRGRRLEFLASCSTDMMFLFDLDGRMVQANYPALQFYGIAQAGRSDVRFAELSAGDDLIQKDVFDEAVRDPRQAHRIEVIHHRLHDLCTLAVDMSLKCIELEGVQYVHAQIRDISDQVSRERQLDDLAIHDVLTGLLNRVGMLRAVDRHLQQRNESSPVAALLFLDMDGFKAVNDAQGHAAGDAVLFEIAARLKLAVRDGDSLARFGGDEFTLLIPNCRDEGTVDRIARNLLDAIGGAPFSYRQHRYALSVSIGVALIPADGDDPQSIINAADRAMYRAKEQGKNRVCHPAAVPETADSA